MSSALPEASALCAPSREMISTLCATPPSMHLSAVCKHGQMNICGNSHRQANASSLGRMQHTMETGEILSTGSVTNLAELIKACAFPEDAFFLAEKLPSNIIKQEQRQDLLRFAYLEDVKNVQDYTSGCIFSEAFELRWEEESGGDYQVVYFGPDRQISGLTKNEKESENIKHYKPETRYYYLFGERLDLQVSPFATMDIKPAPESYDYYATARIPRLLFYPTDSGARRVQLRTLEYLDEKTGHVRLF